MAYRLYVTIDGGPGGYKGEFVENKPKFLPSGDTIVAVSFETGFSSSGNAFGGGGGAGKITYKPILFRKVWGAYSPALLHLLQTGQHIKKVTFDFVTQEDIGKEQHLYSIEVTDVLVTEMTPHTADIDQLNEYETHLIEEVSLSYRNIQTTSSAPPKNFVMKSP